MLFASEWGVSRAPAPVPDFRGSASAFSALHGALYDDEQILVSALVLVV